MYQSRVLQRDRSNRNNSSPKARGLEVQEELTPQLKGHQAKRIFSYLGRFRLFVLSRPLLGRAICFTQSNNLNVNLIQKKKNLVETLKIIYLSKYLGILWSTQVDT